MWKRKHVLAPEQCNERTSNTIQIARMFVCVCAKTFRESRRIFEKVILWNASDGRRTQDLCKKKKMSNGWEPYEKNEKTEINFMKIVVSVNVVFPVAFRRPNRTEVTAMYQLNERRL